jgi:hypothetical protein
MTIDQIREKLALELSLDIAWVNMLDDTSPGHYGVEDWEVYLTLNNIWVDIPTKTFSFNHVNFNFKLRIGSSNKEDSIVMEFSKVAKGKGEFTFASNDKNVKIEDFEAEFDKFLI